MRLAAAFAAPASALLARYQLKLVWTDGVITASYWGAPEAGLRAGTLYASAETPLHSVLHETAHFVCMTPGRRRQLDTDAGGDDAEECAVCYLQLRLAALLGPQMPKLLMSDMDAWGYSFRLGSTRAWLATDSAPARAALMQWGLIDANDRPTYRLRA